MSVQKKTTISEILLCPSEIFQSGFRERAWLTNHGKEDCVNFTDQALT